MKKLIALISAIAVMGTMSMTAFAKIEVAPNAEEAGAALAANATSGYDASFSSADVNTQTTILAVNGTAINTNSIMYINQLAQDSETTINFDLKEAPKAGETVYVYMGGDKLAKKTVGTIKGVAETTGYTYDVALQNVTYNGIAATVARITGLDPTAVAVTVDETVANYYVRTANNENVIVACIAGTYTDVDVVKALVSITEGTTEKIMFGDATGDGATPVEADITELARCIAGFERTKPTYKKFQLPTDLMKLLVLDVTGDGSVNESDITELARSIAGFERTKPTYKKFSLDTMSCYTK